MARIRTIKPEFWGDEKLAPLDPIHRLVFLGLVGMADDAGRLLDSVKVVDAFVFPYTDHTCGPSLILLEEMGRIQRGRTASGQAVIQVVNWHHQKIDKPNLKGALPMLAPDSPIPPRSLADDSPTSRGDLGATTSTNDLLPTTADPARQVAAAANLGLRDNPAMRQEGQMRPLRADAAKQCVTDWLGMGVPLDVICDAVAEVAGKFKPTPENPRIGSFRYFDAAVRKAHAESQGDPLDAAVRALEAERDAA